MELSTVLNLVDKTLKPQKSVQFDISKEQTTIFDCKIGGIPYFPKNMKYPTKNTNKEPLILLAQLNFEQIPHIPYFPKKGILQFFISQDDCYGMNFNDLMNQNEFRIIYHKDIITDTTQLIDSLNFEIDYNELPYKGEYKLIPNEITTMYADPYTEEFMDLFVDKYNDLYTPNIKSIFGLTDELSEQIYTRNDRKKAFIGGYPIFTQNDPRYEKRYMNCKIVLFELDSLYNQDIDIMWGDCGTGTFLISKDNLKKLDFSKVIFNYDCC